MEPGPEARQHHQPQICGQMQIPGEELFRRLYHRQSDLLPRQGRQRRQRDGLQMTSTANNRVRPQ